MAAKKKLSKRNPAKKKRAPKLDYARTKFTEARPIPYLNTARFNGKTYRILYGRSDQALGGCERRSLPRPRLFLDDRLVGVARLDVAIHEAIHASLGHRLSENEVERVSEDVSRFLFRLYSADPESEVVARCDREGIQPLARMGSLRWVPKQLRPPAEPPAPPVP